MVEAIALRKYVKNLNEVLSEGEQSKQNFLDEVQKNLISAQTEKEVALEELATVIDQRDQAVREKDRALEEWGKATSKWENTLDQLDSIMKELSKVGALFNVNGIIFIFSRVNCMIIGSSLLEVVDSGVKILQQKKKS